MKNSNTVWLGNVPAAWKISRIGSVYTLRNTKVSDRDYEPLSVTMHGIVPQLESAAKTNAHDDRKLVKKGDFAINSRSDRRGSCGIADRDGSVSLINTILCPNGEMNPRYYNWLFHTTQFADEFYANGHGIVDDLWTTGWQEMKRILIPLPPLEVQKSIANFLDQKCSEIDSLSADIQSQIDVLEEYKKSVITEAVTRGLNPDVEMKDSGIEWIGMIPKRWDRGRIKDFCKITRGGSPRPIDNYLADENQKGYNWVRIGDTKKGYKFIDKTYLRIIPSGLSSTRLVKKGTLLLTNSMSFGEPYIMNVDGCIHDGWLAFYDYNNISKEFLYYVLMSDSCKTQFILSSAGAVVSNLNIDKVANTLIFVPSIEEQLCIASYLDNKCYQVDFAITDKKAQLETLAEYKKSLIYEYVTGKKEVV